MNEERKYETDIAQPNRGNGVDTKDLVGRGDDYLVNQWMMNVESFCNVLCVLMLTVADGWMALPLQFKVPTRWL